MEPRRTPNYFFTVSVELSRKSCLRSLTLQVNHKDQPSQYRYFSFQTEISNELYQVLRCRMHISVPSLNSSGETRFSSILNGKYVYIQESYISFSLISIHRYILHNLHGKTYQLKHHISPFLINLKILQFTFLSCLLNLSLVFQDFFFLVSILRYLQILSLFSFLNRESLF